MMLRITVHNSDKTQMALRKLQLDLRNVDFVDAKGTQLLRDIYRETKAFF
jgi:anti-anti-sigma regulatory factor